MKELLFCKLLKLVEGGAILGISNAFFSPFFFSIVVQMVIQTACSLKS